MRLYGKNPVLERIKANAQSIQDLYLQKKTDLSEIVKESKKAGIEFKSVDKVWLKKQCGDVHSQGVMAEVAEFEYTPFSEIVVDCLKNVSVPVFLDGITDPQNLGAIVRTTACMSGFSLVLPEHESAHINETVLRVANGGENYIKVAKVSNLVNAANKAKEDGIWIAGALVEGSQDIQKEDLNFPMIIIVGSEGKGIRPGLRKHLDMKLTLPMRGASLSYNAAIAVSLFCNEITRQREKVT